ncbi:MAG: lipocalin-like domain-containing protein, partial [Terriglobales bacterium]
NRVFLLAVLSVLLRMAGAQYTTALPGYHYEFPRDHFNHPDFQTEWWYYTGNLSAADGHRFGFELTFFRQAIDRDRAKSSAWDIHDLYLAHLALSDLDGGQFYHAERTNRSGPGMAGISAIQKKIWNGNWQVQWQGDDLILKAYDDRFSFSLQLHPSKPPVIHGLDGVSQKAPGRGHASHYISLTRLQTTGTVRVGEKNNQVTGIAWMDHEFFTHQLEPGQVGWDWLSLQLNDNTELMLFRIRRKDGSIDPFSAGTYIDGVDHSVHLQASDFSLTPLGETWMSPITSARYPVRWRVEIPILGFSLELSTPVKSQEFSGHSKFAPSYWEGAIAIEGRRGPNVIKGVGYLEMTGYDHPMEIAP